MFSNAYSHLASDRLTRLYVTSLSIVALLSISGQFFIQRQLIQQQQQLKVIGEADGQLIMNQQLSKAALGLHFAPNPQLQHRNRKELDSLVTHWAAPCETIEEDMLAIVSGDDAIEMKELFADMEATFLRMMETGRQMLDLSAVEGDSDSITASQNHFIAQMLADEEHFTQGMTRITQIYEERLLQGINRLKILEGSLLSLTLLVLLLEGYLIFQPAINQLNSTLQQLTSEQEKSERLLLNVLPQPIAERLKTKPQSIAESFNDVTVLFADIVGFTDLSSRLEPTALVTVLNTIFSRLDALTEKHGLEKIKTIGDAYMVVAGLPNPRADHALAIAQMALDIRTEIQAVSRETGYPLDMRIGIHSGPVVAGVIGTKKFAYDLWGDTVNVASRMESHGQAGRIHLSQATYQYVQEHFDVEERGTISVKGKGEMRTFWLNGHLVNRLPSPSFQALKRFAIGGIYRRLIPSHNIGVAKAMETRLLKHASSSGAESQDRSAITPHRGER